MTERSRDWLAQAEDDLCWCADTCAAGRWSQACFVAQQTAEKAMKALAIKRGYTTIRSHSVKELAQALQINDEIETMARRLDLYYISARYPDAFPSGAPFEFFSEEQAREALDFAGRIVAHIKAVLSDA